MCGVTAAWARLECFMLCFVVWAASYLGMSTEMIERVYGHHSPEHLRNAAMAITGKAENVSVVVSVVAPPSTQPKRP